MKNLLKKFEEIRERIRLKISEKFGNKKLNFRESILILAGVAVILIFLGISVLSGFRSVFEEKRSLENAIAKNSAFLSNGVLVKTKLAEKADELNDGMEITGTNLLSEIEKLGLETGVFPESSRPTSKSEGPFDVITARITLKNAPLANLIEFDEKISNEYPAISVTDARFTPNGNDGLTLTATYEITAFLLNETASQKVK